MKRCSLQWKDQPAADSSTAQASGGVAPAAQPEQSEKAAASAAQEMGRVSADLLEELIVQKGKLQENLERLDD